MKMARAFMGPSAAASNPRASNASNAGTPGGRRMGLKPGNVSLNVGDEVYLWLLVGLEVGFLAYMRHHFRRRHGG